MRHDSVMQKGLFVADKMTVFTYPRVVDVPSPCPSSILLCSPTRVASSRSTSKQESQLHLCLCTKSTIRRRREEIVLSSSRSDLTTRRAQQGGVLFLCPKHHDEKGQYRVHLRDVPDEESNHDATTRVPFLHV
jgi:hypothetical protein